MKMLKSNAEETDTSSIEIGEYTEKNTIREMDML